MLRILAYSTDGKLSEQVRVEDLPKVLKDSNLSVWVDFQDEPNEKTFPILLNVFGFHPLAIDDALNETHVPKLDDWGSYLYIVMHATQMDKKGLSYLRTIELDAFLGENYIVTHHDDRIPGLDRVWDTIQKDERSRKMGVDHILYLILDELILDYMKLVEELDDEIENVEDLVFHRPENFAVTQVFGLKRAILLLRRTVYPQQEVLNKLARDEYPMIDKKDRVYFRDVYDHLVRLRDLVEGLRDLVSGVLDIYLSAVNNRMNEIMKTLTIITVLFMPLSFLVGFFGMNFFLPNPPVNWTTPPVFVFVMILMILLPLSMYLWMRRRGWM